MYSVVWGEEGGGKRSHSWVPYHHHQSTISPPPYPIWGTGTKVGNSRAAVTLSLSPEICLLHTRLAYQHIGIPVPRIPDMPLCTMYALYVYILYCYSSWSIYQVPYTYRCVFTSSAVKLCNNRHRAMTSDLIHILISEIENMPLNMSCIV